MAAEARFVIGIDLGTSNCAVAWAEPGKDPRVRDFAIEQLDRPGQRAKFPLFPSFLYFPTAEEWSTGSYALNWEQGDYVAGRVARWRGSKVSGRLVSSSKSWLCHPAVDRTAPILPYGSAAADVRKISPVEASTLLLRHLRNAWNDAHPEAPLEAQEIVLTVPASFDEAARALTVQAAREAGLEHFTLLEEPQAAFYDFSSQHEKKLATLLQEVRLVLVVDIGGGTTDFTLVQVQASPEGPLLRRIAVGEHLILGGDNMDNALARRVEEKLGARKLSAGQWVQLVQAAREAKELLLGEKPVEQSTVSIAGEGSQLLGSSISKPITRAEAELTVLDGFFPQVAPDDFPKKSGRTGIQEMGLPYASEPAITRHLAAFLQRHAASAFEALQVPSQNGLPRPDAILLNGGVFNSPKIAQRLIAVLSTWWPNSPPLLQLEHGSLDLAVARGAAYYGLVRRGQGRRISGGTAHSFYLGVTVGKEEQKAVCLIPRGFEEGGVIELREQQFKLQLGRPVQFPLFTSTGDRVDRPGDVIRVTEELNPLPPIQTLLKTNKQQGEKIPVYLRARLTEIGTVELWCVAVQGREQWRLEFDIRGSGESASSSTISALHPNWEQAKDALEKAYGARPGEKTPRDAKQLWHTLEKLLGSRESWNLATLRQIASDLLANLNRRRRTADHERVFFQLFGFTSRPGFGYPLDEWRCAQAFKMYLDKVQFQQEKPNWNEFWVMWRRISGGLSSEAQDQIWEDLKPFLAARVPAKPPADLPRPKGVQPQGYEEMVRAAASMEHVSATEKEWLGRMICDRLNSGKSAGGPWVWSLGRLGARVPLYGSAHQCVPQRVAEEWAELLLRPEFTGRDGASFALTQICRRTGDRARDVNEALREEVIRCLRHAQAPEAWIQLLREVAELKSTEQARVFGDTLPSGLQLVSQS